MILPMKKLTFLVYHKEYLKFLNKLQDKGLVHVIMKETGDIENTTLKERYELIYRLSTAIKFLERRRFSMDMEEDPEKKSVHEIEALEILNEIENLRYDTELYHQQLSILQKELGAVQPWGDFSTEKIKKIEERGYIVQFFSVPVKGFNPEWAEKYNALEVDVIGSTKYFITISQEEVTDIEAEEIRRPERTLSDVKKEIEKTEKTLQKAEEIFNDFALKYYDALIKKRDQAEKEFTFEKVVLSTDRQADEKLMILEGWIPEEKREDIIDFLEKEGIYYEISNPEPSDDVPIKLKNNRFAKLFESIGELYTLPEYRELDLVPFFAPFYMLFFGFCLGDAGYGLLIILGTLFGIYKGSRKLKPIFKLGLFLGIATTIMGIVGGTFFGIMLDQKESWTWMREYQAMILDSDQMMLFALGLGYIQVLLGMFIKAFNRMRMYGAKHGISQFGWIIIVMITVPAILLMTQDLIPAETGKKIILISAITGGLPALFYNSPGKNPFMNFGVGLWDTYQTASGLLGDVLSYIRLFALGISSAILGNVFNTLAMDLSPSEPIILRILVMILILTFGHSLNFFMAALGSFVHPLRLTFVEFYKNAGFMGGGRKYEPFSK